MQGVLRLLRSHHITTMNMLRAHIDGVLHAPPVGQEFSGITGTLARRMMVIVVCGAIYGGVMGSSGIWSGAASSFVDRDQLLQILYSAVKVPLLLMITFLLSLPGYFVLNALAGLRADFGESIAALVETQAGLGIILASLAPFTLLWYASSSSYQEGVLFNAAIFGIASLGAQRLAQRHYGGLIGRDPRHRLLLGVWLFLFAFIGIQMGWLLRPFIGDPGSGVVFIREESWGNAYEAVGRMIWGN